MALLKEFLQGLSSKDPVTLDVARSAAEEVAKSKGFLDDEKKDLFVALYEQASKSTTQSSNAQPEGRKKRRPLQDYVRMGHYLTDDIWQKLLSSGSMDSKCEALFKHLSKLGLELPSEPTFGMSATLLLWSTPARHQQFQLHGNFLKLKKALQTHLKHSPKVDVFIEELPADFDALPEKLRSLAFPSGAAPAKIPVDEGELFLVFNKIPQRNTKKVVVSCASIDNVSNNPATMTGFLSELQGMMTMWRQSQEPSITYLGGRGKLGASVREGNLLMRGLSADSQPSPNGQAALMNAPSSESLVPQGDKSAKQETPLALPEPPAQATAAGTQPGETATTDPADRDLINLAGQNKADADGELSSLEKSAQKLKQLADKKEKCKNGKLEKSPDAVHKARKQPAGSKPGPKPGHKTKPGSKPGPKTKPGPKPGCKAKAGLKPGPKGKPGPKPSQTVAQSATKVLKHDAKKKAPIPSWGQRMKLRPEGCSACRARPGCCRSCWLKRGYRE